MNAFEDVSLAPGRGRISGVLSTFLGSLSVLAVLCFHFPQYLTTPELRQSYDVDMLRTLLKGTITVAAILGGLTLLRGRSRRLGFAGIMLALVAVWLGGGNVEVGDFEQPVISFGLDWLLLALLANTLVFVFIERMWPLRSEQRILRREWKLDLVYYVFNHLMISVILLVTTFFSERLFGWAVHHGAQTMIRAQPTWLQFVEVLFLADFVQYWGHRAMHEHPRLWNVHAVHHCPARMDWLSGSRIHFAEVLFTRTTVILPIFLLGFDVVAVNAYVIWVGVQGLLIHANARLTFGPLRHVITTPHFHHWHHSADAEAIDRNYAAHLPLMDRLFGTYLGNGDRWPRSYGVVGKPLPQGFLAQHLYPFTAPPKGTVAAIAEQADAGPGLG